MIEPIEELRKTAGDALAESLEAGYKVLVESQHTRRAILVNMLYNKAYRYGNNPSKIAKYLYDYYVNYPPSK